MLNIYHITRENPNYKFQVKYIYKTPARKCLNIAWSQQEGGGRLTAGVRRERTPHIDKAGRGQTPTIDVSTPLL